MVFHVLRGLSGSSTDELFAKLRAHAADRGCDAVVVGDDHNGTRDATCLVYE
jgi:hypothetical protein